VTSVTLPIHYNGNPSRSTGAGGNAGVTAGASAMLVVPVTERVLVAAPFAHGQSRSKRLGSVPAAALAGCQAAIMAVATIARVTDR
jgi:hypothetical protein